MDEDATKSDAAAELDSLRPSINPSSPSQPSFKVPRPASEPPEQRIPKAPRVPGQAPPPPRRESDPAQAMRAEDTGEDRPSRPGFPSRQSTPGLARSAPQTVPPRPDPTPRPGASVPPSPVPVEPEGELNQHGSDAAPMDLDEAPMVEPEDVEELRSPNAVPPKKPAPEAKPLPSPVPVPADSASAVIMTPMRIISVSGGQEQKPVVPEPAEELEIDVLDTPTPLEVPAAKSERAAEAAADAQSRLPQFELPHEEAPVSEVEVDAEELEIPEAEPVEIPAHELTSADSGEHHLADEEVSVIEDATEHAVYVDATPHPAPSAVQPPRKPATATATTEPQETPPEVAPAGDATSPQEPATTSGAQQGTAEQTADTPPDGVAGAQHVADGSGARETADEVSVPIEEAIEHLDDVELTEVEAEGKPRLPPRPKARTSFTGSVSELAGEQKRKQWWEELFTEEFARSNFELTETQLAAELDFIEDSLGVETGGTILDLACGDGRYTVGLAQRGIATVGLDLSSAMLARAGQRSKSAKDLVRFVQGDMRELEFDQSFDGILCWNASFGYFEEEKNQVVLQRVFKALKPGGSFLLDVPNRDFVASQQPCQNWFEGDGCICMDDMHVDFITSRMSVKRTIMLDDGRNRECLYSMRLYGLHELGRLLHNVGFRVTEVTGQIATPGVFFGVSSPRIIILVSKP